ncbi:probable cysteine--tRNA ligase, mitochondrial [Leptopilina heterotoma]|uniref:probable cysteine--tRNA ligase, mitochondrial n=1 Tax=Leptopilina heterotoma TaxID=63436 RepID=UPI001CA80B77|nr:probable cysteine--tRNA ligase, mitochondrial [Leptopilina heterotoma]
MKFLTKISHSICKRLLHTELKKNKTIQWIQPDGFKTNITLYNSLLKSKFPLILKNKNVVTWYMCGPTLYDSAHIGHASTYVRCDIIRRILTNFHNLDVVLIMGLTDIDDKIIKRSQETNQSWKNLTMFYEEEFFRDMKLLNVAKPYMSCRVTDNIEKIIKFIENIFKNDAAYQANDGSVYFDTLKFGNYGKFRQCQEEKQDSIKKSSLDFALWKAAKENEPFWESPWGNGRPGWHIECSVMASAIFGSQIDIHSGGKDLEFPHHENEEAQSCCHHGIEQWINYWIHTGHLHSQGDVKMSKSLKNTISIEEFLKKHSGNEFRLLCLMTHYRKDLEFSEDSMQLAVSTLSKIENFISDCRSYVAGELNGGFIDESFLLTSLTNTRNTIEIALADDFNTPEVVHSIVDLVKIGNKMLQQTSKDSQVRNPSAVASVSNYITTVLTKLGLESYKATEENQFVLTEILDNFVAFRKSIRTKALEDPKDINTLKMCDEVRQNLLSCGIQIKVSE